MLGSLVSISLVRTAICALDESIVDLISLTSSLMSKYWSLMMEYHKICVSCGTRCVPDNSIYSR